MGIIKDLQRAPDFAWDWFAVRSAPRRGLPAVRGSAMGGFVAFLDSPKAFPVRAPQSPVSLATPPSTSSVRAVRLAGVVASKKWRG